MKNKLNLKGQFNNSQTAVNPTEVGPATVNRRSRLMSVLCLLALLTLGTGQIWANNTSATFYLALEAAKTRNNNNCCNVQFNIKYDGTNNLWSDWTNMTKTSYTYNGKVVYQATYKFPYDGYHNWQWRMEENGNQHWYKEIYAGSWNTDRHNGQLYDYENAKWVSSPSWDASYTVYFADNNTWGGVKAYAWNNECDYNAAWAGTVMTSTGKTYKGKNIYSITLDKRYANLIFSKNGDADTKTGDLTLGSTNAGKMYLGKSGGWTTYVYDHKVIFNANGGSGEMTDQTMPYNTATALKANTFTRDGYRFDGWATSAGGTVAYADGASVIVTSSDLNLYAKWVAEETHDVTVEYYWQDNEENRTSIKSSATESAVGVTTARSITAPEIVGYEFWYWELETGLTNKSANTTTNPISVVTKTSGTYTLKAIYKEVLESTYYLVGETTNSLFPGWDAGDGYMLTKWSGYSTSTNVYYYLTVTQAQVDANYEYEFKIYNSAGANDNAKWIGKGTSTTQYTFSKTIGSLTKAETLATTGTNNLKFKPNVAGEYEFKVDYSTAASPVLTIKWPEVNKLQITSGVSGAAAGYYDWDSQAGTVYSKAFTVSATGRISAKIIYESDYYACNVTSDMTISDHANWRIYDIDHSANICNVYAPVTGTYTFRFNSNNSGKTTLTVDFPEASRIIYGVGTLPGGGAVTVSPSFASEDYVLKTQAITFTRGDLVAGYAWKGWFNNAEGTGVALGTGATYTSAADTRANNTDFAVYACYDYATYSITLDQTGRATAGSQTSVTGTYNSAMPDISGAGKLPTAPDGYCFMGYWDAANGEGTQYYNANGTSAHVWDKTTTATLYAYYRKAVITALTFDAAAYEPEGTVGVTPTVSPTPTGTTVICWEVQYANGNPLDPQPTITSNPSEPGAKITFPASATSGTYKVQATLRTGSSCDGGTELSTQVMNFQVAGEHTVTVQYKCGSENIKASTSMEGVKPLEWSDEITPPAIFGYTFLRWVAIDGVSITTDNGTTTVDSTTTSAIKIKAIYDGRLIAKYTKKQYIYLDISQQFSESGYWENPHVYFYKAEGYWNETKGAGATGSNCVGKGAMLPVEGASGLYYYDYSGVTNFGNVVAFTWGNHMTDENFGEVCDAIYRTDFSEATPLFIPAVGQNKVTCQAKYYNRGYWVNYVGEHTGYSILVYDSSGETELKRARFTSDNKRMSMKASLDLDAATTYKFEILRDNGHYYKNNNNMTNTNHTNWEFTEDKAKGGIITTAAGEYTFTLGYADNNNDKNFQIRVTVDYPAAVNDFQVLYNDNATWSHEKHSASWVHPSRIITARASGVDTISFFVAKDNSPILKARKVNSITPSTGAITWGSLDINGETTQSLSVTKSAVYNFKITQGNAGVISSIENIGEYTGNYYIRTGAANNKWDNYKSLDHTMTYSEYSEQNSDYTHYWMAHIWADNNVNLSFVVANDYSPCISDTMIRATYRGGDAAFVDESGVTNTELNIRYMWHRHDNSINRAYLSPAQASGSKFLVLRGNSTHNLRSESGALLTGESEASPGNNHGGGADCMQFIDDENWIYETTVKVAANSYVKLYAKLGSTYFYYRGTNDDTFDASHAVQLITGADTDTLKVRVIYDFKTDRLLAAYLPEGTISENLEINADVMFIREHQGDISQVTFSGSGSKISEIKTAYAVMRFNKWTLNNKSKEEPHGPLGSPLSRYERDIFYVSFPFRVNLNEVFGFGTYGVHWIMEEYDGAGRAEKGFWKDSPSFWKFITNRQGKYLEPNVGYILALDLDELGEDASVWNNNVQNIELFFPSTTDLPDITSGTVTHELPAHTCTINRNTPQGDRRIADSHWNIMAVPTYVNTNNISFANTDWTTGPKDPAAGKLGPNFLYTWNPSDNTLTPTSASGFTYHAMHAYTVQYYGDVTWTTSVSPSAIVAREKQAPRAYEWCLEIQQDSLMIDRTYVRMTDEEEVTSGFEFGYDMSKSMNRDKANIYTFIGSETVAGNSLPLQTEQTTVVPVGVTIKNAGEYTFAMPEGTNGVGVTLVDTEANVRTSLSALDYTVSLEAGEYTERFVLEISPVQNTPTDLGNVQGDNVQGTKACKVMIDGILYIVKDGKMYDARGARVE